MLDIQRRLQHALQSGTDGEVIAMSKEMTNVRVSQSEIEKITAEEDTVVVRPVLQFKVTADVMVEKTRDYLGSVRKMEMTVTQDDVTVEEKFKCTENPGLDVFSLCHVDEDPPTVNVSYDNETLLKPDMPSKVYRETGECVRAGTFMQMGRRTFRCYAKGRYMSSIRSSHQFTTFSKSLTAAHFRLDNYLTGRANIDMVQVLSTDPLRAEPQTQLRISVGHHRAFDVDETEQQFVVVEEARPLAMWRAVRLYRRPREAQCSFWRPTLPLHLPPQQTAVATYAPPTTPFQPSDVCFCRLGGQPVLLITDEVNDAIHVAKVEDDRMTFQRYLCAGNPLLVQPTAITVDRSGRLWVGCRGGRVVTLTIRGERGVSE